MDHGEVSKGFNAAKPGLLRAMGSMSERGVAPALGRNKTAGGMAGRTRWNYATMRNNAGRPAEFNRTLGLKGRPPEKMIATARREKAMAHASVTAAGNISRREGRHLP